MTDSEQARLERIGRLIESADSPVGIDARKTHVLILHKLTQIEQRLARLEQQAADRGPAEGRSST